MKDALALWRTHLGALLCVAVASFAASRSIEWLAGLALPSLRQPAVRWQGHHWKLGSTSAGVSTLLVVELVVKVWVFVAAVRFLGGHWRGTPERWREVLRFSLRRAPAILWTYLRALLAGLLGGLAGMFLVMLPLAAVAIARAVAHVPHGPKPLVVAGLWAGLVAYAAMARTVWIESTRVALAEAGSHEPRDAPRWPREELELFALIGVAGALWPLSLLVSRTVLIALHHAFSGAYAFDPFLYQLSLLFHGSVSEIASWCLATVFGLELCARRETVHSPSVSGAGGREPIGDAAGGI